MKKLYCLLFLLPAVCYASPTRKPKKNLEQQIIALQQEFESIDKKVSALVRRADGFDKDLLLAQQRRDTAIAASTCDTEQSTQTVVEETTLVETTEEVSVKKPKLSWGRRIAPKEKTVIKEEVKKRVTIKEPILTKEQIADALDSQGDN